MTLRWAVDSLEINMHFLAEKKSQLHSAAFVLARVGNFGRNSSCGPVHTERSVQLALNSAPQSHRSRPNPSRFACLLRVWKRDA
jgi:hypothetical protein